MVSTVLLRGLFPLLALIATCVTAVSHAQTAFLDPSGVELGAYGAEIGARVDSARFVDIVKALSPEDGSRAIGMPANIDATDYIARTFTELGFEHVVRQDMSLPVPRQHYAYAVLPRPPTLSDGDSAPGDTVHLHSLMPNFARTNTIVPGGISGHIVYSERGYEREYNGHAMAGSILLAEGTVEDRWKLAATLGSRAAIFIEPDDPYIQAGGMFETSVNFPRFWVPREVGAQLKEWAEANPETPIQLCARQPWEYVSGANVLGFLPGSDPVLSSEVIILTAPFDAMSSVVDIAPGAEAAVSPAALLEMAHLFTEHRNARSVYFAALNGQYSGTMLGGRTLIQAVKRDFPAALRREAELLRKDMRLISDPRLAGKFPEYKNEASQLEALLNTVLANEVAEAERRWQSLSRARESYRQNAAVTESRRGSDLYDARREHAAALEQAAAEFVPAYHAAVEAFLPVIDAFGQAHARFIDLLEHDREELLPIIEAGEDKIRTSLEERLAAARLSDINKAYNKVSRIGPNDHLQALDVEHALLATIEPVLGRYPSLVIDLSLTSNSDDVGVFYKGYFYNQQPDLELKRAYGPIGRRFDGYATNLTIVNDLTRLWSMSDDSIRSLIWSKVNAISERRDRYREVEPLTMSGFDEIHHYSGHHRFVNATAWLWALAFIGFIIWRMWVRRSKQLGRPPISYWLGIGAGLFVIGLAATGHINWHATTRVYRGIDTLMWEHTDLLVNAERIPREDKTKIRLAAETGRSYTEITEAPEFFAENVIAAIPATVEKLDLDSANIAKQLGVFDKLVRFRDVSPADLRDQQLDSLNAFIRFLGLQGDRRFVDAVAGLPGKSWNHFLPSSRFFTSEIATLGGLPAVAISTLDDRALLLDSPSSTVEHVNFDGALAQMHTVTALIAQTLADPYVPDDFALGDYFAEARGVVLYDDRVSSVTADVPVDSAVVLAERGRYNFAALTDRRGSFEIVGLPIDGRSAVRAWGNPYWLHAYKMNPDSGSIFYAVDLGNEQYTFEPSVGHRFPDWMMVVFDCVSVSVTNVLDQRYFQYLSNGEVFDARTDAKPWHFYSHIAHGANTFFVEPETRVKFIFKQGILGIRAMLTNVPDSIGRPEHRQGIGFPVESETLITNTIYQAARDMWQLDEARLTTLVRHGIIDEGTRDVHQLAAEHLANAKRALAERDIALHLTEARTALALESRVLPDILSTANGALKGVLFYMALLLPFAFFLERLLIGAVDVKNQALWFFAIFIAMFVLIEQVHPAFDITVASPMVLLAFTVFALSLFVVSVIIGKFTAQMQQIRKEQQGYLSADVGRISAMFTAFMLGVSNMRKRKIRTALTCATLIILTFTVLSFTSVSEVLRVNRVSLGKSDPVYSGVLIRDRMWNFWPAETLPAIENEFGEEHIVVGRAWREAMLQGAGFVFTLEAENGRKYTLSGFVGMEPDEDRVTGIFRHAGLAGRWFVDSDLHALVIPRSAADALHIPLDDVTGDIATAPKVRLEGVEYSIVGVLDDEALRQLKDLDGEDLTPVDWSLATQQRAGRQLDPEQAAKNMNEREAFVHYAPAHSMFMPLRSVTGGLVSVAVRTEDPEHAKGLVEGVIPKWALEMYVGEHEGTYLYSAVGLTTLGGLKDVLIPILIAALIVLNTMLSAVYERTREIGIFSSVGLAPSHIAMLFMAEATVYAVLGAIAGYLLGQTVGQAVYKAGMLGGITLNYSSLSAVASTIIVMVTVLLSTIWPARKASQLAVPDIARTWRLPDPQGDDWYFKLPFTLLDEELEGVNAFLKHYFEQHHDESSSDFYIDRVEFWSDDGRFMLETMAWLAPYDLGVSQLVTVITTPVPDEKGLYQMSLLVSRESGDVPSWVRVNRRFVNFLRKQFLIWRSLTPEERHTFILRGREMFSVDGHRAIERAADAEIPV